MRTRSILSAALGALFGLNAGTQTPVSESCTTRMSDLQTIGSHNSYKLAIPDDELARLSATSPEWGAAFDYGHVSLSEQLNLGMRQLELDVFYDPEGGRYADPLLPKLVGTSYEKKVLDLPGFKVLHVQDVDPRSSCLVFKACLAEIRGWMRRNSDHAPILILINAKQATIEVPGSVNPLSFDAAAVDALDAEIRSMFPGSGTLLTPDAVRGDYPTLREAIATEGWPSLDQAWGKVFFALDEPADVVDVYRRGETTLRGHAMFVNSGDPAADDAAYFTINDPIQQGDVIAQRVDAGFIVRTRADADTIEARTGDRTRLDAALASGAQYISTDYYRPRREWSDYVAELPGKETIRANPRSTCAFQ